MIVFSNALGNVIYTSPEAVYQGSSLSGTVYFLAPFGRQCSVSVSFELPDGSIIGPYAMTPSASITGVQDSGGDTYNSWIWSVSDNAVTSIAGTVVTQFTVYLPNGTGTNLQKLTTATTQFIVEEGVLPEMPEIPDTDTWEVVLQTYNALAGKVSELENKVAIKLLVDFSINSETGEGIKYYTDGTTATVQFPISGGGTPVIKTDFLNVLEFTADSWLSEEDGYSLAFGSEQTGFTDNKYFVCLEQKGTETYEAGTETTPSERTGYYTSSDSIFKGTDGSLYITANAAYAGRLITIGGVVFSGNLVEDVTYNKETHDLTVNYINSTSTKIKLPTKLSEFENDTNYVTYIEFEPVELRDAVTDLMYEQATNQLTVKYRTETKTDKIIQLPNPGTTERYNASVAASDWTGTEAPYTYSISSATHGKGTSPIIQSFGETGAEIGLGIERGVNGDITLYTNEKIACNVTII